jgi:hypothetical protein
MGNRGNGGNGGGRRRDTPIRFVLSQAAWVTWQRSWAWARRNPRRFAVIQVAWITFAAFAWVVMWNPSADIVTVGLAALVMAPFAALQMSLGRRARRKRFATLPQRDPTLLPYPPVTAGSRRARS